MSVGVALLLCDNIAEARVLANELDALNQTRKEIEQGMQTEALTLCEKLERSGETLPGGLAMYHPEWHQGVVGIWPRVSKSVSPPGDCLCSRRRRHAEGSGDPSRAAICAMRWSGWTRYIRG